MSPRTLRRALDVVGQLPPAALAELIERLVNRLDAGESNADAEDDDPAEEDNADCCDAGDDDPVSSMPCLGVQGTYGPGDPADGEPEEDDEPGL